MGSTYPSYASKHSTDGAGANAERQRRANGQFGSEEERRAENLRREADGMGATKAEDVTAAERAERKVNGWGSPIKPRMKPRANALGSF